MSLAAPPIDRVRADLDAPSAHAVSWLRNVGAVALAALPGLLTLYLSFNSGGYFPGATGVAAAVLAAAVVVRMALARTPFAGFSRPLQVAAGALAFFSVWTLASSIWSHSPSRALLYFDLSNVYLFALILFGSAARSDRRVRWMVVLTWLSMLIVCIASLATRLRPDLFPIPVNMSANRLAFPLTYWNALGLFAVCGLALAAHFASSVREPRLLRVLGAAAIPVFAVTMLLTYSRAAIILGPAVLLAYAVLGRPRGLLSALLAAGPVSAVALLDTYHANLISSGLTTAAAVQQGRQLSGSLMIACAGAAVIRFALLTLDKRMAAIRVSAAVGRRSKVAIAVGCALILAAGAVGFGGRIVHEWNNFVRQDSSVGVSDVRNRIGSFRIGGRLEGWRIALQVFDQSPVHGHGADTFALDWERLRNNGGTALQTHSLYLEAMSELGVVGLILIVIPIVVLISGCLLRARRSNRARWTAVGLVGLAWAVHAGVDWDWQMPAVTLPVFALTAAALARRGSGPMIRPRLELVLRVAVGLVSMGIAFTALHVSVSDANLNRSVADFSSGNCRPAQSEAHAAIAAVPSRPQPYAVLGYCELLRGRPTVAMAQMRAAVATDPENWRYHYDLAIADAAAGSDPRPQLRRAERLDPLEATIQGGLAAFTKRDRSSWPRLAKRAPMPVAVRQ